MGNKIKISSLGLLYQIVILFGLSVASYADDVDHVYNQWIKNAYKYNEPILSEIKGQNIESYRFVFDSGEWGLRTVVRITKYNNKYMLNGIKVGNDDYGYDGKGTNIEAVISKEEWNTLSNYIQDLSYESMSPQHDDYMIFDAGYIILEGIKNGTYYYVGRYSPDFQTEERKLEKFRKTSYRFQRYFYKISKDKTRERVVIDLSAKNKKREVAEALQRKQQEEEKERLYAQRVKEKRQNGLWKAVQKAGLYPFEHFKDLDANIKNEEGQTPLMIAVKNGYTDIIRSLDVAIVNVREEDYAGKTAYDYIQIPTSREEDMYSRRMYGALRTLEVYQIIRGKAKMLQYSYENDTDMLQITIKGKGCDDFIFPKNTQCNSIKKPEYVNEDIFKAIKNHNNTLFDDILPGVDLEMKDKRNYSLLWRAIISKNLYAVDQLLQQGVDIDTKDNNNHHSPIYYATINNKSALLNVLLKHGVDVNSKNQFGSYVLSTSMQRCTNFEAIALLLDNGANPYLKDKRGKTIFDKKPIGCKDKSNILKMRTLLKERSAFSQ